MSELVHEATAAPLFELVERGETDMPEDYLPGAGGAIFPGEHVQGAGGASRPRGWRQLWPGNYRKYVGKHLLMVRRCVVLRTEHWTVERLDQDYDTEALVLALGPAQIFCHTRQAAMRLAEHCYPEAHLPIDACWMVARRRW